MNTRVVTYARPRSSSHGRLAHLIAEVGNFTRFSHICRISFDRWLRLIVVRLRNSQNTLSANHAPEEGLEPPASVLTAHRSTN